MIKFDCDAVVDVGRYRVRFSLNWCSPKTWRQMEELSGYIGSWWWSWSKSERFVYACVLGFEFTVGWHGCVR